MFFATLSPTLLSVCGVARGGQHMPGAEGGVETLAITEGHLAVGTLHTLALAVFRDWSAELLVSDVRLSVAGDDSTASSHAGAWTGVTHGPSESITELRLTNATKVQRLRPSGASGPRPVVTFQLPQPAAGDSDIADTPRSPSTTSPRSRTAPSRGRTPSFVSAGSLFTVGDSLRYSKGSLCSESPSSSSCRAASHARVLHERGVELHSLCAFDDDGDFELPPDDLSRSMEGPRFELLRGPLDARATAWDAELLGAASWDAELLGTAAWDAELLGLAYTWPAQPERPHQQAMTWPGSRAAGLA